MALFYLEQIEWKFACNFGFIHINVAKLPKLEIFDQNISKSKKACCFSFYQK
jgi:hypothetical protein